MSINPRPPLNSRRPSFGGHLMISSPQGSGRSTRVWLNGQEISSCLQAITFRFTADGGPNYADLVIRVDGVEIDAQSLAALTAIVKAREGSIEAPAAERNEGWGQEAADDDD